MHWLFIHLNNLFSECVSDHTQRNCFRCKEMASDKRGPRNDNRKSSSSYCSGITIVIFVSFCLVGVWMMTSATVAPVEFSLADTNRLKNRENKLPADSVPDLSGHNSGNKPEEHRDNPLERAEEEPNLNNDQDFLKSDSNTFDRQVTKEEDNNTYPNSVPGSDSEKTLERINDELGSESSIKDERRQKVEENLPDVAQAELLNETSTQNGSWLSQDTESKNEKEKIRDSNPSSLTIPNKKFSHSWKLCNVTVGADYIPCLDNEKAIKMLQSTKHYEHRERHCPELGPTCLVPLPNGYKSTIKWPISRDKVHV
jgi:Putative S-adenosyl-L-methionine-dependent methyltransferase